MTGISENLVLDTLRQVIDPDLNQDIVTLGFVQDLEIDDGTVKFKLVLTTPACPMKDSMKADAEKLLLAVDGIAKVQITLDAQTRTSREPEESLPDIKHILLIGSGKGGVGKSTVAVNLAGILKETGATVGILDADIYGPSIPPMLGISEPPRVEDKMMIPPVAYGMPIMSIGFLTGEADALIWRGPILHQVLRQFVMDVKWGDLDYLIVDLPPGTGDVQISLAQLLRASGALLVSTPQDIAWRDVRRAAVMFSKINVPIIGLVENMAYFVCPDCGGKTEVFPKGEKDTLRMAAPDLMVETLVRIPIEPAIAVSSESGKPIVLEDPECDTSKRFRELAGKVAQKLSVLTYAEPDKAVSIGGSTDQD